MSEVRLISDDEFEEYARITLDAYPAMFTDVTEERRRGWIERMKATQDEDDSINYYGCYRGGKMVGGMRLHDFKMTLYGSQVLVGGVGNFCVDLLRRKEHVSKEMMEYFHRHYRGRGGKLVALYPFRPDYYVKMGYGYGRKMNQYRFRPEDLPRGPRDNVSYLDESDKEAVTACFNRYARRTHGMIEKRTSYFERLPRRYKVIEYKVDGVVRGFMAFGFKKLMEDHVLLQNLEIHMLIYETPEALMGLMSFLSVQLDQVDRVVLNTQDDDWHFILKDPRNGVPHMFYTSQETNVQGVGIMYRVIDSRGIWEEMADHSFNEVNLRVKLTVRDSFIPENDGSVVVHFTDGKPEVVDGGDYDVEASMDVSWFSSLVMGVVDFRKLWAYGRAEVSDESYIDTLDRLFYADKKPETIEEF
ncbi:MAG TPA: GNAT family N-acetyltransferase [Candidatus Krumholzibacteriaceae bacterium]|nr:GNAT family N-acetyltransferase [Candidatus Krumholzibacteriaceae bacterium]